MKTFFFKSLTYLISKFLILLDLIFRKFFKTDIFLPKIHDLIENKQYYTKVINTKTINFFCPSTRALGRVESLFSNESQTLNWIDNFQSYDSKKIVFWDIGANIGLFSMYAALKFQNIEIISFEPSTSNTRTLSRNISINNLYDKIKIFPLALSDKENIISFFNETKFSEGGSISNFNNNVDFTGKVVEKERIQNKYNIYGTKIDYLIKNNIICAPNYIKIDVDGIEHLILEGGQNLLKNVELRELLIEMTQDYIEQYKLINKFMDENGFKKIISSNNYYKDQSSKTANILFKRN